MVKVGKSKTLGHWGGMFYLKSLTTHVEHCKKLPRVFQYLCVSSFTSTLPTALGWFNGESAGKLKPSDVDLQEIKCFRNEKKRSTCFQDVSKHKFHQPKQLEL